MLYANIKLLLARGSPRDTQMSSALKSHNELVPAANLTVADDTVHPSGICHSLGRMSKTDSRRLNLSSRLVSIVYGMWTLHVFHGIQRDHGFVFELKRADTQSLSVFHFSSTFRVSRFDFCLLFSPLGVSFISPGVNYIALGCHLDQKRSA